MAEEIGTHTDCAHAWETMGSVGRHCQKCQLPWETWAEQRMTALEARLDALLGAGEDIDVEMDVAILTLLPPQTEYTCPACNGTGQTPLGEYAVVCSLCSCPYEIAFVESLNQESVLPCGHGAKALAATTYCLDCGGSGTR